MRLRSPLKYKVEIRCRTKMVTRFVFMRHGEAAHNVAARSSGDAAYLSSEFRDARLTDEGTNQCNETGENLSAEFTRFDAIYTSPLARTIQSAVLIKQWVPSDRFYAEDSLIERQGGGHCCNERLSVTEIADEFGPHGLDCSYLTDGLESWVDREPLKFIETRIVLFLRKILSLYTGSDVNILIVTHHDVLYTLLRGVSMKVADFIVLDRDELAVLSGIDI